LVWFLLQLSPMSLSETATDYAVEISSTGWKQLSFLALETYQLIRGELDAVADRLARMGTRTLAVVKTLCEGSSLSVVVGEYVVLYDVDPERGRVILREVARRLPQGT